MLTLRTGLPGHGKTLFAIDDLRKIKDRPIYYSGISGLNKDVLGWQELDDPQQWRTLPAGAILLVDEAHKYFPVRRRDEVPEFIEQLAEHRHYGLDIHFITQHPTSIDIFLRRRIGEHIHVVRPFGVEAAIIYRWPRYEEKTGDHFVLQNAEKSKRTYPKDVYEMYESAEIHTVKKRFPKKLFLLPVMVIVLVMLSVYAWGVVGSFGSGNNTTSAQALSVAAPGAVNEIEFLSDTEEKTMGQKSREMVMEHQLAASAYVMNQQERIKGVPWSASFYQSVFTPSDYPRPYCIEKKNVCRCYTQQATRLKIPLRECRYFLLNGFFDPTKEKPDVKEASLDRELERIDKAIRIIRGESITGEKESEISLDSSVSRETLRK